MRIALFGGSFDPPHVGHQLACQYVLLTHPVDEVWLVPVFRHAFDKRSVPFEHRVAMCRIAAAAIGGCQGREGSRREEPRVRVCTIEEELSRGAASPGPSYTLHTVRALKQRHPGEEFALIIGTDLIKERERWYHWPELAAELPFIVIGRDPGRDAGREAGADGAQVGSVGPVPPGRDVQHAEPLLLPAVSSTEVRERLRKGERPAGWVAAAILDYIEEHGLYRNKGD
jgi:nicotinate-nucleotide adenylyltransferase